VPPEPRAENNPEEGALFPRLSSVSIPNQRVRRLASHLFWFKLRLHKETPETKPIVQQAVKVGSADTNQPQSFMAAVFTISPRAEQENRKLKNCVKLLENDRCSPATKGAMACFNV